MSSPHSRFRFGTAEFDESRQELKVAGLVVEVEPRVLGLLAYLLRHAGEVVSKEELLREVWAGRVTVEKVLPNAINKLRRALGEDNAQRVTTQARIGYRLDGPVQRETIDRRIANPSPLAVGAVVPGRSSFVLQARLAANAGAEVWTAEHAKTREQRVYKFAVDPGALRHLKRETTLLRVLADSLPEVRSFATLLDWNFEAEPPSSSTPTAGRTSSTGRRRGSVRSTGGAGWTCSFASPGPSPRRIRSASCTRTSSRRTSWSTRPRTACRCG